jgi:hypothetical protein
MLKNVIHAHSLAAKSATGSAANTSMTKLIVPCAFIVVA